MGGPKYAGVGLPSTKGARKWTVFYLLAVVRFPGTDWTKQPALKVRTSVSKRSINSPTPLVVLLLER